MVDERIMTRFDKMRMEGRAEGRSEGLAEGRSKGLAEGRSKGLAEGRSKGLAEGRSKGLAEGKAEVAWNLLKAGVSKDIIVQTTGLTIADIEKHAGMAPLTDH